MNFNSYFIKQSFKEEKNDDNGNSAKGYDCSYEGA